MKNQYFGDINDYRKYGLLRALQSGEEQKLLIAWMLTPDDGRADGRFRTYLKQPAKWKHFDPELFTGLSALLQSASAPQVSLLEGSSLLPRSTFYSEVVPDSRCDRDLWRKGLIEAASGMDLVFVDPDNGIEVPSMPVGRRGSSKYVTLLELQGVWEAGYSLLIYQHFRREPRDPFAAHMASEVRKKLTGAPFTQAFRTGHVLFLLAAQAKHEASFRKAILCSLPKWKGQIDQIDQIEVMGLANKATR